MTKLAKRSCTQRAKLKLVEELREVKIIAKQAFIFDLDGVITVTAEYHYRAWKSPADAERIPFAREDSDALRGVSRRESLTRLLKGPRDYDVRGRGMAGAEEWLLSGVH